MLLSFLTRRSPVVLIWPKPTLPINAHPVPNQGPKGVTWADAYSAGRCDGQHLLVYMVMADYTRRVKEAQIFIPISNNSNQYIFLVMG